MNVYISLSDLSDITVLKDDVKLTIIEAGEPEDWGDEEIEKMVTPVRRATLTLSSGLYKYFENPNVCVTGIRYGYYNPCYNLNRNQKIITNSDEVRIEIGG